MTFYKTLDEALLDIASRSFCEDATVTPTKIGFTVEDDYNTSYAGDSIPWTYGGGMELPADISDNSRLHDPAEYYDRVHHLRFNLPAAIEALEAGHMVTFAYAIVEAFCERDDDAAEADHNSCECLECDSGGTEIIGWTLLAYDHGPMA